MYLQSLSRLYRSETVTLEAVTELAGVVPQTQAQAILDAWMSKDAGKVEQGVTAFVREGYSATQLLSQVFAFALSFFFSIKHCDAVARSNHDPPTSLGSAKGKNGQGFGQNGCLLDRRG